MQEQNIPRDIDVFVDNIDLIIDRLHTATQTNSPKDLADRLHTTRSAIAEARRRGSIPLTWLLEPYLRLPGFSTAQATCSVSGYSWTGVPSWNSLSTPRSEAQYDSVPAAVEIIH